MPPLALLQRLKERKLVQWGLAYLAGAFVVFQAVEVMAEPWSISPGLQRVVHVLLLIGLFITLVLAWYHGEKGRQRVSGPELLMVAALLVIAGGVLALLGAREGTTTTGPAHSTPTPERDRPTLAVLPFANMSAEADEDAAFFATGLHDDLITQLSKIAGLDVIARTSVMQYGGTEKTIPVIGQELGVGAVLEGSVMRAGDQVRLNVQLIDARTDTHLWAETYDRVYSVVNVFSIQTDLAGHLARTLQAELFPAEEARIAEVPTESEEAYTFFLRGKDAIDRAGWEPSDFEVAREMLSRAVDVDPEFALAHAWLSRTYTWEYWFYDRSEVWLERSRAAVEEALRLRPDLPEAHLALAQHHAVQHENEEAMKELRLAEQGLPGGSDLMVLKSMIQTGLWQWDAALATLERAARLDPRNAETAFALGEAYASRHRWGESDAYFDLAMDIDPSFYEAGLAKGHNHFLRTGDGSPALEFLAGIPPEAEIFGLKSFSEWLYAEGGADRMAAFERIEQPIIEFAGFFWAPRELVEGWTYAEADPARARRALEVAVAVSLAALDQRPGDPMIHATLGRAYAALGQREEAVREARLVQELLPVTKDPEAGRELLRQTTYVYAQLGMVEETVEAIETLVSIPNPRPAQAILADVAWRYPAIRDHPLFQALLEEHADDVEH
ncbi:tetratricopeptide repeat protein [Gemmatimonadota bacterium]